MSRPDWQILQGLSVALDKDMGFHDLEDIHEEMAALLSGRPGLVSGSTNGRGQAPPHERGEGELVLFTYPLLVDEGRLLEGADELKAALQEPAFVEVHPDDAERLGLSEGVPAQLRTDAGQAILPVRITDKIAAGSAFVPFNNPGLQANTLLSGRFVTTVAVEAANGG